MKLFLCAIGLMMIFEGLPYFAFPEKMQEMMRTLSEQSPDVLRIVGLLATILGLVICYVVQRTSLFQ